jgi:sigma-B regulation protein RsbU (phosphoserine phosphatase)
VKLRSVLLLSMLALLSAALVTALVTVSVVLERMAYQQVGDGLERARSVFEDLQRYREVLFRSSNQVLAEEPRLKAVMSAADVSPETVHGVTGELRSVVGSDLFLLVDPVGRILSDAVDTKSHGADLSHNALVMEAVSRGEASAVWTTDASAYQVQARQLRFGVTPVGILITGYALDSKVAQTVFQQTSTSVVVELEGRPVAASAFDGVNPTAEDLLSAVRAVPTGAAEPIEVEVAGERHLALATSFPGYRGDRPLRYVLLRSLDSALAPSHTLQLILWGVLGAALVGAAVLSAAVSARLARPVQQLAAFTERVGAGALDERIHVHGPVELQHLGTSMNRMAEELHQSRQLQAEQQRLKQEMVIAEHIQTSILPTHLAVPHLELAARMQPATEVGGDYYDVVPVRGGAWIGIGDVAGHGVPAGIVMLMIQSAVAAVCRQAPDADPRHHVCRLNELLYENIRVRMKQDEHVTFTLLRFFESGRLLFAGSHEDILIWRAAEQRVEVLETPGTWLGAAPDISQVTVMSEVHLRDGDVVLLHTDGATQARDTRREEFGLGRLTETFSRHAPGPVQDTLEALWAAIHGWCPHPADDVTLLLFRYTLSPSPLPQSVHRSPSP